MLETVVEGRINRNSEQKPDAAILNWKTVVENLLNNFISSSRQVIRSIEYLRKYYV